MPGFASSVSNNIECVFAANADFSTANSSEPKDTNGLQTNGQMWIGSTALNAGNTHINVGTLTSPDGSITIGYTSPNITLQASGATLVETLTPDEGAAVGPIGGTIGVKGFPGGSYPGDSIVTHNFAAGTLGVENRRWTTSFIVDPSSTIGVRGTYSTVQAAVTAAAAAGGGQVFIRTGTYTENVTLSPGVDLIAYNAGETPNVTIIGKLTATFTGKVTIYGIRLQTNSDYFLSVTGAGTTNIFLINCRLICSNNTGINYTTSGGGEITIMYTRGTISASGIALFTASSNGVLTFYWTDITNTGSTTTASTSSATQIAVRWSRIYHPVTTSGTGFITATYSQFDNFSQAVTELTIGGSVLSNFYECFIAAGSSTAITISTSASFSGCVIDTTSTSTITGAGTIIYNNLQFHNTGSTVSTTTQTPRTNVQGAVTVKTPGGYPYTTLPTDYVILVDTSSARTINLNASPVTGQTYRIKDNVGSAAANNVTITPAAGNIDGSGSYTINTAYGSVDICYNGTQWNIL